MERRGTIALYMLLLLFWHYLLLHQQLLAFGGKDARIAEKEERKVRAKLSTEKSFDLTQKYSTLQLQHNFYTLYLDMFAFLLS